MDAVLAWAQAAAEVERLRRRQDELDAQLGDGAVDEALTEVTQTAETEDRPAMGQVRRESLTRQRESLSRAVHRAEMRLRTMRVDLWKRMAAEPGRKTFSMALLMAEQDEAEQHDGTGTGACG